MSRGVAANAPAFPMLSDDEYRHVFPQEPGLALTGLGEAAVRATVKHKVVVDVSHMRADAIEEALKLLDECDPTGDLPVIASHVGARSAAPGDLEYNLAPPTMQAIAKREGLIGLILSAHLMGASSAADAILHANADRVVRRVFELRER